MIPDRVDLTRRRRPCYLHDVYSGEGCGACRAARSRSCGSSSRITPTRAWAGTSASASTARGTCSGSSAPCRSRPTARPRFQRAGQHAAWRVQPLDAEGRAVQMMRSWMTAHAGRNVSCVGCHEQPEQHAASRCDLAMRRRPSEIEPWYGPARGFSFKREVQPVLDKYCVGCHNGRSRSRPNLATDRASRQRRRRRVHAVVRGVASVSCGGPGPESDYHVQMPMEYHASTSELVQMLEKGHYNVKLDAEAWDRLITWIDLNVPDHGTWHETAAAIPRDSSSGGWRCETVCQLGPKTRGDPGRRGRQAGEIGAGGIRQAGADAGPQAQVPSVAGWPFDAAEAKRRQDAAGLPPTLMSWAAAPSSSWRWCSFRPASSLMGDPTATPTSGRGPREDRAAVLPRPLRDHQRPVCAVRSAARQGVHTT